MLPLLFLMYKRLIYLLDGKSYEKQGVQYYASFSTMVHDILPNGLWHEHWWEPLWFSTSICLMNWWWIIFTPEVPLRTDGDILSPIVLIEKYIVCWTSARCSPSVHWIICVFLCISVAHNDNNIFCRGKVKIFYQLLTNNYSNYI